MESCEQLDVEAYRPLFFLTIETGLYQLAVASGLFVYPYPCSAPTLKCFTVRSRTSLCNALAIYASAKDPLLPLLPSHKTSRYKSFRRIYCPENMRPMMIGDLVHFFTEDKLLYEVKNLGKTGVAAIKALLEQSGLQLGMRKIDRWSQAKEVYLQSLKEPLNKVFEDFQKDTEEGLF